MSGNKSAVLDSNILIYLSKKQLEFGRLLTGYDNIFISVITQMEVLGFDFQDVENEELTTALISQFQVIHTDAGIADQVIAYRKNKKIKLPDAIILATAKIMKADLVTVNEKDFVGLDEGVGIMVPKIRQ